MRNKYAHYFIFLLLFFTSALFAKEQVVNVYAWSAVIPDAIIQQFEKETGIKVNFSTYDSNETLYAKLRASSAPGYDVIEPSSYYIDRMRHQRMLQKLDKTKLSYFKHLNPLFLNQKYDPNNLYSFPFIWGVTGIFLNQDYFSSKKITGWSDLWDKQYNNQLMFLNDSREAFSIALKILGYSLNDNNPDHIKKAYLKLKELMPNIKLFNSEAVISILVDEDATLGVAWNGDVFKARRENKNLDFVYPKEGFIIWVDNFAIPKNPPHLENAYQFLNFMSRPDIAKIMALENDYATANLTAQKSLPPEIKNNLIAYPTAAILKHGEFQTDISDSALALYEKYWEELKMSN